MASVSGANLSTKAKVVNSFMPAFSEEVISNKDPRTWGDLPEHIMLKVFETLAKDEVNGLNWVSIENSTDFGLFLYRGILKRNQQVSRAGRVCKTWRRISQELLLGDTAASRPKRCAQVSMEERILYNISLFPTSKL